MLCLALHEISTYNVLILLWASGDNQPAALELLQSIVCSKRRVSDFLLCKFLLSSESLSVVDWISSVACRPLNNHVVPNNHVVRNNHVSLWVLAENRIYLRCRWRKLFDNEQCVLNAKRGWCEWWFGIRHSRWWYVRMNCSMYIILQPCVCFLTCPSRFCALSKCLWLNSACQSIESVSSARARLLRLRGTREESTYLC